MPPTAGPDGDGWRPRSLIEHRCSACKRFHLHHGLLRHRRISVIPLPLSLSPSLSCGARGYGSFPPLLCPPAAASVVPPPRCVSTWKTLSLCISGFTLHFRFHMLLQAAASHSRRPHASLPPHTTTTKRREGCGRANNPCCPPRYLVLLEPWSPK